MSTIKIKNENDFFLSVRGYGKLQNVREKSGKGQGILRWMISGNPGWDLKDNCMISFLVSQ